MLYGVDWYKGGIVNWDEGVPQVCDVMHHTHQAYNKTNKEMVIMMIDVKMDTVVELWLLNHHTGITIILNLIKNN